MISQEICPMCQRKGIQKIIDGFLCYIHGKKKNEKCCRWGQIANISDLVGNKDKEVLFKNKEVLLFINIDLKSFNKKSSCF